MGKSLMNMVIFISAVTMANSLALHAGIGTTQLKPATRSILNGTAVKKNIKAAIWGIWCQSIKPRSSSKLSLITAP